MFTQDDVKAENQNLAEENQLDKSVQWRAKAMTCKANADKEHNYIPIAWQKSVNATHVTMLMCMRCFHEINISNAFEHRNKA